MSFIIGVTTDEEDNAFDVELVKFENEDIKRICTLHNSYVPQLDRTMKSLKENAKDKTSLGITSLPEFKLAHDEFVEQAARLIEKLCIKYDLNKSDIDFVIFYGKKLDCKSMDGQPYSLQMGSGKMLADLTGTNVIYGMQTIQKENTENGVLFFSYLGNLFKSMMGISSNRPAENDTSWIGTKVATRSIYRAERFGYADYKYDDMLNDTQMTVQERKKIAQYDAWKRRGNQGRFGR